MKDQKDIRIIIMAGGIGTRFWPLSRKKRPKQFLPILSDISMIEETFNRLLPLIPASNIYTIANQEQSNIIKSHLPGIPGDNILVEPQGKNTAPCLILATATIFLLNPEAVIAVLPADHLIKDGPRFLNKLIAGAEAAATKDSLITFGIPPVYPATGYGYIRFSQENSTLISDESFYPVQEFKEKPDLNTAIKFLEAGNYYWNSGMFLWQAKVFAQKLKQSDPSLSIHWDNILKALQKQDKRSISGVYEKMPSISIDYALMEKAHGVMMAKGDFGWSDVGAWSSLSEIWAKDDKNNAIRGEAVVIDSENCLSYNPNKLTALVGVKDIIVVNTDDALLICSKDNDQKVKDVVMKIKNTKKDEYL